MTIGYKDVYDTYCKLVIHAEVVSWQRFHVLLVFNSILVLSWVTMFKGGNQLGFAERLILGAISLVGIIAALAWEDLGDRGRKYLDEFKAKAKRIEQDHDKATWWEGGIEITDRPFQIDLGASWYSSSKFLLRFGPIVFLLLHAGLLLATLTR